MGGFTREAIDGLLGMLEKDHIEWSHKMAPIIMGNLDRPQLSKDLAQDFCENQPTIATQFAQVTFLGDWRSELPKVKTPTLILQSQDDAIAPETAGRFVHEQIKNSEYKILNSHGHCPHMSAAPEIIAAIKGYLK